MNIRTVKRLLNTLKRFELNDYAFGDSEVCWKDKDGQIVAEAYFSRVRATISVPGSVISGPNVRVLRDCGHLVSAERNDAGVRE